MKKKVLLSIVIIIALLGTMVFATESLTPTTDADALKNTQVVDATDDVSEETEDEEEGMAIPEEWRRELAGEEIEIEGLLTKDDFVGDENVSVVDKTIDGNAFYAGSDTGVKNVNVYGDLFVFGKDINIKNVVVSGNIYVAGKTISMDDINVSGNVYTAGEELSLGKVIAQDIFMAGKDMSIKNSSNIVRSVNVAGSSVKVEDTVIGRDVNAAATDITIGGDTVIKGELNYSSENEANLVGDPKIGKVNFNKTEVGANSDGSEDSPVEDAIRNVVTAAVNAIFICGFITLFAKGFIEKQKVDNTVKHILVNTGLGFLWTIVLPIIAIAVMCTGFGVGVGFIILALYVIAFAISKSILAVTIAAGMTKKMEATPWKFYGITLLVVLAIAILEVIPVVGGIVAFVQIFSGMGLVVSGLKCKKVKKEVEPVVEA